MKEKQSINAFRSPDKRNDRRSLIKEIDAELRSMGNSPSRISVSNPYMDPEEISPGPSKAIARQSIKEQMKSRASARTSLVMPMQAKNQQSEATPEMMEFKKFASEFDQLTMFDSRIDSQLDKK